MDMTLVINKIMESLSALGIDDASADDELMNGLGLSSLEIFVLLGDMEKAFSIKIPERVLMRVETVGDLAKEISSILNR